MAKVAIKAVTKAVKKTQSVQLVTGAIIPEGMANALIIKGVTKDRLVNILVAHHILNVINQAVVIIAVSVLLDQNVLTQNVRKINHALKNVVKELRNVESQNAKVENVKRENVRLIKMTVCNYQLVIL